MQEKARTLPRPRSPRISIYHLHPQTLASGAHRLSGVVLILFLPCYLWLLAKLSGTAEDFQAGMEVLHSAWGRIGLGLASAALIYHWANGLRFLLLDCGIGEQRQTMRRSAQAMLALAALSVVLLGLLLW